MSLALYLKGDGLKPRDITKLTGVVPTRSQEKEAKSLTKTKQQVIARTGLWALETNGRVQSEVFQDHIDYLKASFGKLFFDLSRLPFVERAYIDLLINISTKEGDDATFEFEMTTQSIDHLKELGLPIKVTIYS